MSTAIHHGDCLEVIPRLVADGVVCDAVVTDAPYHLTSGNIAVDFDGYGPRKDGGAYRGATNRTARKSGFMGQQWDGGDIAFRPETWATIATILRPGAFLIAFGGTRTYHRLVCAIEDGGFVIHDQIAWMFGTGFPKRRDMLKPAFEPICLAYKPGGKRTMQVDECRIATGDKINSVGSFERPQSMHEGWARPWMNDREDLRTRKTAAVDRANELGRWPANVAHDGSDEVLAAFPDALGSHDQMASVSDNSWFTAGGKYNGVGNNDKGSAARFFYTAKADKQDRWGSRHPTVKPIDLIRWLVRLVTPPGGLVLDPFAGSGTTGAAAFAEGRNAILIEREDAYVADIRERMAWCEGEGRHSTAAKARRTQDKPLGGLFEMAPT